MHKLTCNNLEAQNSFNSKLENIKISVNVEYIV